jgi:AraC-like DNA-binding protein
MKITEVFLSSGFANETTFFRIFKAVTGMTPNEWKANMQSPLS